jgi:putative transposase
LSSGKPKAACINSRSVKTTRSGGEGRGANVGKKNKETKQHIFTDTLGFLLAAAVYAANVHEINVAQ